MRRVAPLALLGLGLGAFSVAGDGIEVLAGPANSVGPWIIAAFAAGFIQGRPRQGAVAGASVLLLAVAVYYIGVRFVWGDAFAGVSPVRATAVWGVVAVIVGAPLGLAGGALATGRPRWRIRSIALLSGLLLAEAVTRFVEVEGWTGIDFDRTALQVWAYDTIAAILAPILLARREHRVRAYAASAAVGAVGAVLLSVAVAVIRTFAAGT